jgi:predicted RNA-binding Zn-ribbon protein involved in translation (DUF1610 family)
MTLLIRITQGKAFVKDEGLRCGTVRLQNGNNRVCNRLLMKLNPLGQAAGDFKCPTCGQHVVVELAPAL